MNFNTSTSEHRSRHVRANVKVLHARIREPYMRTNCGSNERLSWNRSHRPDELLCLKVAKKRRYTSQQAFYFAKNSQPHRSRVGRELTLTLPASVAYTQYSCASYYEVCGHSRRTKSVIMYPTLTYLTAMGFARTSPPDPPYP